jgi:hypothetical protein
MQISFVFPKQIQFFFNRSGETRLLFIVCAIKSHCHAYTRPSVRPSINQSINQSIKRNEKKNISVGEKTITILQTRSDVMHYQFEQTPVPMQGDKRLHPIDSFHSRTTDRSASNRHRMIFPGHHHQSSNHQSVSVVHRTPKVWYKWMNNDDLRRSTPF